LPFVGALADKAGPHGVVEFRSGVRHGVFVVGDAASRFLTGLMRFYRFFRRYWDFA
jgi:hypothetical protein